jgi:hypothetical protein
MISSITSSSSKNSAYNPEYFTGPKRLPVELIVHIFSFFDLDKCRKFGIAARVSVHLKEKGGGEGFLYTSLIDRVAECWETEGGEYRKPFIKNISLT